MEEREREGQPFSSLLVSRLEIKLRSRARPQRPPPPLKVHLNQGHRSRSSDHPPTPFSVLSLALSRRRPCVADSFWPVGLARSLRTRNRRRPLMHVIGSESCDPDPFARSLVDDEAGSAGKNEEGAGREETTATRWADTAGAGAVRTLLSTHTLTGNNDDHDSLSQPGRKLPCPAPP